MVRHVAGKSLRLDFVLLIALDKASSTARHACRVADCHMQSLYGTIIIRERQSDTGLDGGSREKSVIAIAYTEKTTWVSDCETHPPPPRHPLWTLQQSKVDSLQRWQSRHANTISQNTSVLSGPGSNVFSLSTGKRQIFSSSLNLHNQQPLCGLPPVGNRRPVE